MTLSRLGLFVLLVSILCGCAGVPGDFKARIEAGELTRLDYLILEESHAVQDELEAGADPNVWGSAAEPPLVSVVTMDLGGRGPQVRRYLLGVLLEYGAVVDQAESSGATALMRCRDPYLGSMLLDAGASLSKADARGQTALHHAVTGDAQGMVALLLERGAPQAMGPGAWEDVFVAAAEAAKYRVMEQLLEVGAPPGVLERSLQAIAAQRADLQARADQLSAQKARDDRANPSVAVDRVVGSDGREGTRVNFGGRRTNAQLLAKFTRGLLFELDRKEEAIRARLDSR